MGKLTEFSLPVRLFLKTYRWRRIEPVPWTPMTKNLSECRLALVSSAGLVMPGQPPFDPATRGGDVSFREIPSDIAAATLFDSHRSNSFDHSGIQEDPNLAFPIDRVREMVQEGRIDSVADRHISFMGSITAPGRLMRHTAPEVGRRLLDDDVDICVLVPV